MAYVADITVPKDRGKYYGLLGAAGGVGFMMGPAIGGLVGSFYLTAPFFLAAGITLLNMVWGYFVLPESLPREHKVEALDFQHLNPFRQFSHVLSIHALRWIFLVGFLFYLAMNATYGNASVFMKDVFSWNTAQVGLALFVVGVFDIVSQGFLVRKLLPKFGEARVAMMGLVLCAIGFGLASAMAIVVSPVLMYVAIITYIIGDGLFEPSISSLISSSAGPKMQGRVQGASQGMQSIARIIGPLCAAGLYAFWRGLPYASEAAVMALALVLILVSFSTISKHQSQAFAAN